jgi:tetratricopeptide (TPR) repeat protein
MVKSTIKLVALTVFAALVAAPLARAGGDPPTSSPPVDTSTQQSKKSKRSSLDDTTSTAAYRTAYETIYDRNEYAKAIDQLKAIGRDDNASVATLIGYSYRKLGDYRLAQIWYERALKTDPDHVRTWQYYGLWQIEQGNRDQAEYHLQKIAQLSGTASPEYRSLAAALAQPPGTGLVY